MSYTNKEEYSKACHKGGKMTSFAVSLCTDNTNIARAAFRAGYDMLKNHVNKSNEEYSFLLGLSNTDLRKHEKTPNYHLHGVIKGPDSHGLTEEIVKCTNRKAKLANEKTGNKKKTTPAKKFEIKGLNEDCDDCGMRFVGYVLNQCSYLQQYSNATDENKFDFRNFEFFK